MLTVTPGEAKQRRLRSMSKGVVAAALAIDRKMRGEYGEPLFRSESRSALAKMKNPYRRNSPYRVAMITLTYRPGVDWQPSHIRELTKHYREWMKRKGHPFHFVWSVELQDRGVPHYHVIVWLPKGCTPPLPDRQGWWKHGHSNAIWTFSPVGYVAKYVGKMQTKSGHHLPKGARLWGYGGLKMVERASVAFAMAPGWLKRISSEAAFVRRQKVVTGVHRTAAGVVLPFVREVTAWVATQGDARGWAYFSPYRFEDIGKNGLMLSHSGVIECLCPEGDSYFIPHKR